MLQDEDLEDLTDEVVEEDDGGEPRDWKDLKISVYSPRADSVLKVGLKTSRT
jgi:RNA-binding protein YlmH